MLRRISLPLVVACLILAGGTACGKRLPDATPADLPEIRRNLEVSPQDEKLRTRLGIALYRSGDLEAAEEELRALVDDETEEGAAYLFLGLTLEDQEDWGGAREAYQTYLATGRYEPLKQEMRDRLTFIARQEIRAAAREAVARESQLSTADPEPRTVAVLPFRMISDNPDLEPLRFALADLMITDISLSNEVRVLERGQIQAILDEMALTEAGLADETTGARAGRILQAENVIQGALTSVGSDQLQILAGVVNTTAGEEIGSATDQDLLGSLFAMEKVVVFQLLDVLGVELTPAERQQISENRVDNIQAFLNYGRGLQALDQGAFSDAATFFSVAAELDPGFGSASQRASEATSLNQASTASTGDISSQADGELQDGVISPPADDQTLFVDATGLLSSVDEAVNSTPGGQTTQDAPDDSGSGDEQGTGQDTATETTGTEGTTTTEVGLPIVIPVPGSSGNIIIRIPMGGIR